MAQPSDATDSIAIAPEQIERLLRVSNWSANELAEELYAILASVRIIDGQPTTPRGGGGGGFVPGNLINLPTQPGSGALPSAFPIAAWGIVRSKVEDRDYLVDVYLADPEDAPPISRFRVRQRQIDTQSEIPAGTEIPVLCFAESRNGGLNIEITSVVMQVPVYLERPAA